MISPGPEPFVMLKNGNLDIAIGAKFTSKRAKFAYYSTSYKSIRHYIYVKAEHVKTWPAFRSFLQEGNYLGAMLGWGYPPGIARLIESEQYIAQIRRVSKQEQLTQLLFSNRVDAIIMNPKNSSIADEGHGECASC